MDRTIPSATAESLQEFLALALPPGTHGLVDACAQPPRVFRGVKDASFRLETGLDRMGVEAGCRPHSFTHLEWEMVHSFIRSSRGLVKQPPRNLWEHLALAQHYGLPTRLLDWTFSPLVALHFAVDGTGRGDRAVWVLDWAALHRTLGLPTRPVDAETLETGFGGRSILDAWYPDAASPSSFCCLFQPPAIDARIVAQGGVFTLASETSLPLDGFLAHAGMASLLTRIVIPARACDRLRLELGVHGIHAGSLFPDLDGVARGIKSRFMEYVRQKLAEDAGNINARASP